MRLKLSLLAVGLLSLSACGVYQDYPNDETAIEPHREHHMHDGHKHHDHGAYGHDHEMHHSTRDGDVVIGQDKESYMEQNDDKWMYNSCPPGAVKRGDC